jgi:membrane protein required for colicin V production
LKLLFPAEAETMMAMNPSALNSVDYFVLFIFGLSILVGYMRGFLREVISLITWVAATAIATLFADKLAAAFSGPSASATQSIVGSDIAGANVTHALSMLSVGVSFTVLFMGTMLVGYLIGTIVTGLASGTVMSLSNRFLGGIFGAARAFIIVILFMLVAELTPMGSQPAWGQSQFVKSFQPVVAWIEKLVHPELEKIKQQTESAVQAATQQIQGATQGVSGAVGGAMPTTMPAMPAPSTMPSMMPAPVPAAPAPVAPAPAAPPAGQ